jgi:hypothetical protein
MTYTVRHGPHRPLTVAGPSQKVRWKEGRNGGKEGKREEATCQSHLAIIVEVWVEAYASMSSGLEIDQHGGLGVVLGEEHVKLKATISIRSIRRSSDKHLEERRGQRRKMIEAS